MALTHIGCVALYALGRQLSQLFNALAKINTEITESISISYFPGFTENVLMLILPFCINGWSTVFSELYLFDLIFYLFIAIFKNKAYIHKNETNPRSLFELPLEMHIELHEGESQQFWL